MTNNKPFSNTIQKPDRREFCLSIGIATGAAAFGKSFRYEDQAISAVKKSIASSVVSAVVLGSAQDGGVPHAGCHCSHCEAARQNPQLRRRSPCLAILHSEERKVFLLDAGPDLPSQLEDLPHDWRKGRNPVDGILLTHAHIGHYLGLAHLGREVMSTAGLPVYCSEQMAGYLRGNGPWSLLVKLKNIDLKIIKPGSRLELAAGLSIEPISVPHRAEFTDTLAFLVSGPERRLLYLPDIDRWEQLQPPIEKIVAGVDIALLDGTFYSEDELPGRDMTKIPHPPVAETVTKLAAVTRESTKMIYFIHLNHSNLLLDADDARLRKLWRLRFDIARDGTSFAL